MIKTVHSRGSEVERTEVATQPGPQRLFEEGAYVLVPEDSDERPQSQRATEDWFDLLLLVVKRWRFILTAIVAGAALAAAVSFAVSTKYASVARIMPPQQSQTTLSALLGQLGPLGMLGSKDLGLKSTSDLYVDMLQSRTIADALIQQFELKREYNLKTQAETRLKLASRSSISATKDGIISISVLDPDARKAAAIANAYVTELYKLNQALATTEAGQRRVFYEQQLEKAKEDLARAEVEMKQTEESTGMLSLEGQTKAAVESAARLQALIAAKEVEVQRLASFATEQNPELQRLRTELAALRQQQSALQSKGPNGQLTAGKLPEAGLEYVRKMREFKYRETLFEILARQFEAAKMDESKNASVVQVLDPAVESEKPSSPVRSAFAGGGALAGLFFAVLIVFGQSTVARWRRDPERRSKLRLLSMYLRGAGIKR
ncbi:MAG TPA: Wzz/FepE/Etk N-terminal domain-containing protein [Candidatus Angelobacter sp.]